MPVISTEMLRALKRARGESNLTVEKLASETGVSRWTLDSLLKGEHTNVRNKTMHRLSDWLYKQV